MNFKEFFKTEYVIKETPDGFVGGGYGDEDARTFILMGNSAIAQKEGGKTHFDLVQSTAFILKNEPGDEKAVAEEKSEILQVGTIPTNFHEGFVDGSVYGRDDVARMGGINGRLWLTHNRASFWQGIQDFSEDNVYVLVDLIKEFGLDPMETIFELNPRGRVGRGDDYYTADGVIYRMQDFINYFSEKKKQEVPQEPSPAVARKSVVPSSLPPPPVQRQQDQLHMISPEKKANALRAAGVKPKPAMGAQARFLRGESINFKEFFDRQIVTESPDAFEGDSVEYSWTEHEARTFFIVDGIIIASKVSQMMHYDLIKAVRDIEFGHLIDTPEQKEKTELAKKQVYMSGPLPQSFRILMKRPKLDREQVINMSPFALAGRIWIYSNKISFWNRFYKFRPTFIPYIEEVMRYYGAKAETAEIEIATNNGQDFQIYAFPDFVEAVTEDFNEREQRLGTQPNDIPAEEPQAAPEPLPEAPEPPPALNDAESDMIHLIPPEKKAQVLKARGIKPKVPIPIEVRNRSTTSESVSNNMQFEKLISLLVEKAETQAIEKKPMSPGAACHKWARLQMRGQMTPERNDILENIIKRSPSASTIHAVMHKKARFQPGERAILQSKKYTVQYGMFLMRDIFKLDLKAVQHLNEIQQETFFRSLINARSNEHIKHLISTLNPTAQG